MRRFTAGLTLLAAMVTLLALPLGSAGAPPNLAEQLRTGVNKTLGGVNDLRLRIQEAERQRREREAARRRLQQQQQSGAAAPRQASPGPSGQGYVPPLHGRNPHGQGTPTTIDLPASSARPLPPNLAGGNGEIVVAGRTRGEQNPDGSYHGHITIAALNGGNLIVPIDTGPGESETFAPLQSVLDPICTSTQQNLCLSALNANSSTTASGSANSFHVAQASVGGAAGINATAVSSNGRISEDANCQNAHGDSNVADAAIGTFTADAIQSTNDSRECKDGTQTQTATSRVVNLGTVGLQVPGIIPAGCANGTPNTPALIPTLLPAICNANTANAGQTTAPYGVREGLTTFVLAGATGALTKATTGASESHAVKKAQCSDGIDNDGDGRIDFPADPDCTSPTDDSEAGTAGRRRRDDGSDRRGERRRAECEDGRDNDGDGLIDFPNDPGCTSRSDDSEANAAGGAAGAGGRGGATECSDGIDNDGDGRIDFPDDPQCESAADDSEADGVGGGRLAFTGTNLLWTFLFGALVLLAGLKLRQLTGRRAGRDRRARMA